MKNSWQLMINSCSTTQWILQFAAILAIRRTHIVIFLFSTFFNEKSLFLFGCSIFFINFVPDFHRFLNRKFNLIL